MMMTKSPPSTCGAKVVLCLPRRRIAVWLARRPRTTSVASMTCQVRVTSAGFGVKVRNVLALCLLGRIVCRGRPRRWCVAFEGARHNSAQVYGWGDQHPKSLPWAPKRALDLRRRADDEFVHTTCANRLCKGIVHAWP